MDYDPKLPLPYPIFVGDDDRAENVPGYPFVRTEGDRTKLPILLGFQPNPSTQRVEIEVEAWRLDPNSAVRRTPVFAEPGGIADGMFNLACVITGVTIFEAVR